MAHTFHRNVMQEGGVYKEADPILHLQGSSAEWEAYIFDVLIVKIQIHRQGIEVLLPLEDMVLIRRIPTPSRSRLKHTRKRCPGCWQSGSGGAHPAQPSATE